MTIDKEISKRLKFLRESYNYTTQTMSEKLKIPTSTISCYETGRIQPSHEALAKYSDYFDVSIHYLRTGENSEYVHWMIEADKAYSVLFDEVIDLNFTKEQVQELLELYKFALKDAKYYINYFEEMLLDIERDEESEQRIEEIF